MPDFEWGEEKRRANLAKHGVDFDLARQVDWPQMVCRSQVREGERRYVGLATHGNRVYVIARTFRRASLRVISQRKANARESRIHEQAHHSR